MQINIIKYYKKGLLLFKSESKRDYLQKIETIVLEN